MTRVPRRDATRPHRGAQRPPPGGAESASAGEAVREGLLLLRARIEDLVASTAGVLARKLQQEKR